MPTRFQLMGIALAGTLVWALIEQWKEPLAIHASGNADAVLADEPPPVDPDELQAAHERETEIRIQNLTRLQAAKLRRDLAAGKMAGSRELLRRVYASSWATVLTTNWPAFLNLRQQAEGSSTEKVPCTICAGTARLPYCILCSGVKGKCVSCRDAAAAAAEETCPTCLGSHNCFLCFGSGQMPCPFCNEGVIEAHRPLPSNAMPIY